MPGSNYFKNHMGMKLTEEQFEDIPYPATELYVHVTQKTVQSGALLGTFVFGPIGAMARPSTRNYEGLLKTCGRYGRNGMILGLGLGPLMTYMRARSFTSPEQYIDRDYRLRHNRGQVRVDRGAIIGMIVGTGASLASAGCPVTGAAVGIATGVMTMALYNQVTS